MMTDLTSLTLAEARSGLAGKAFTALELTDAHLEAIEDARALNAFVMETPAQARAMAREADAKIAKGIGGPLAGIPLGIKDLFATKDVRTTACSKILGNFVPPYESTVTSQLWRDGARHRRFDPPAGGVHRDRRPEADLWALFALGHRRVCVLAGSGRADRADRPRRVDPDAFEGRSR